MRRLVLLPLCALLLLSPATAAEVAPLKNCQALLKSARGEIDRTARTRIEDIPGGCRFTHVELPFDELTRFSVEEFMLLSPDLLATFPTGEVLANADLTLNGLAFGPGDTVDLNLAYTTNPKERTARLETLSLDAGALGRFRLFASLADFDNTDIEGLTPETGRLTEFGLALDDNGLVAHYLTPLAVDGLLNKVAISTSIRALPESVISMVGAESLVRFVTALPEPRGRWTLFFDSQTGLPLAELDPGFFADLENRLPRDAKLEATADYRP